MTALIAKLKREPVAFYGGLVSALLVVLAFLGVDGDLIALIGTIASLVGIPVTRAQVTPVTKTPGDAGHAGLEHVLLTALAIALGLVIWSLLGAHTDLF